MSKPSDRPSSAPQTPDEIRAALRAIQDTAEWNWIAKHLERNAVIIVSSEVALLEAGVEIALDNAELIQKWIETSKLSKPTKEQIDRWNEDPTRRFQSLVVQPYVLIQELLH